MSFLIPSEADIINLSNFLRSLTNQNNDTDNDSISETNEDYMNQCPIPSPVAFEEVENDISLNLSFSSKSNICQGESELYGNLTNVAIIKSGFESDNEMKSQGSRNSNYSNEFSDISSNLINNLDEPSPVFPFTMLKGSPFHLFDVEELDRATEYSQFFSNSKRHAAYYGEHPYSYGKTSHPAKPFSENQYLQKIASYIQIVIPGVCFNSAMVHKYHDGHSFMPHHADNEEEIVDGSSIVTISLGETRFIEFKNALSGSKVSQKLTHGDVFVMSKSTQSYFTHSIPPDQKTLLKPRLSVTFRLISAPDSNNRYSPISPVSELSPTTTVTDFLMDLTERERPEGYVGDVTPILPPIPSISHKAPEILPRPKLLDNIHPSRLKSSSAGHPINPSEPKPPEKVLYISSSMFRNIDPDRLSSKDQEASKLFYPGADAARMLLNVKKDQYFGNIDKNDITKIFILTGSNDIDNIHRNNLPIGNSISDITELIRFLGSSCPNANINVLNILPRQSYTRCQIINAINSEIKNFCDQSEQFTFIDTYENFMFSNHDGSRRNKFFMPPGRFGPDNVHLNAVGVVRLGKHLKYLAHQN